MNQTWENKTKPNFGSDFGPFGPNLSPPNFFVSFTSTTSETLLEAIILGNVKEK